MADDVSTTDLRHRIAGGARTGIVTVRDFDRGVVETLGAKVINGSYYITALVGLDPAPGSPGVPVVFAHPEDVFKAHKVPVIEVRRDDISPAMNRWQPGTLHYRTAAASALPVTVTLPNGSKVTGYSKYEEQQQSCPFDLMYTINIQAKSRQYMAAANQILAYVLKRYQPYGGVLVQDSIGDVRSYESFMESISPMDESADVAERMIGFALSLRVEGELDINDPEIHTPALRTLIRYGLKTK